MDKLIRLVVGFSPQCVSKVQLQANKLSLVCDDDDGGDSGAGHVAREK